MWKTTLIAAALLGTAQVSWADRYVIDTSNAHASISFKIKRLGYSWLIGRFNQFSGQFEFDPKAPQKSSVTVDIDTQSLDSNHAERDKHLRGSDFLNTSQFPKAHFVGQKFVPKGNGQYELQGELTLKGVTKPLTIEVTEIGAGSDPWGGYRQGFSGETSFKLKDFGINYNLGPASEVVYMQLEIEGIKQ